MKKKCAVALLLIAILCIGLCSCGSSEPKPEELILGQWYFDSADPKGVNNDSGTLVIEEDGLGSFTFQGETTENDVQWTYNEETEKYEVIFLGYIFTGAITNVDGIETLNLDGLNFTRITDNQ